MNYISHENTTIKSIARFEYSRILIEGYHSKGKKDERNSNFLFESKYFRMFRESFDFDSSQFDVRQPLVFFKALFFNVLNLLWLLSLSLLTFIYLWIKSLGGQFIAIRTGLNPEAIEEFSKKLHFVGIMGVMFRLIYAPFVTLFYFFAVPFEKLIESIIIAFLLSIWMVFKITGQLLVGLLLPFLLTFMAVKFTVKLIGLGIKWCFGKLFTPIKVQ